jgi:hypothetical protein
LERELVVYAAGQRLSCRALDISAGGVCLLPPVQGDPGLLLRLNISFSSGHTVAVDGVVVREGKVGSRYAWGVRFHRVAPRIQKQLSEQVGTEERRAAGDHVPSRRVSTGRGHPRVAGQQRPAAPSAPREPELDEDDEAIGAGEYKHIGRRSRERIRGLERAPAAAPDRDALRTSNLRPPPTERPATGPAFPAVGPGRGRGWEIDLMATDDPPDAAVAPGARPMRPLVPTGPHQAVRRDQGGIDREPESPETDGRRTPRSTPGRAAARAETGPGYSAVRGRAAGGPPTTGPAHPAQRAPKREQADLDQAIGDELESLLKAAMDKLDEER